MVWIGPDIGKPHFLGAVNRWYSRTEPLHSGGFADKIRNRYLSRFYGGTVGTPSDCGDRKGSMVLSLTPPIEYDWLIAWISSKFTIASLIAVQICHKKSGRFIFRLSDGKPAESHISLFWGLHNLT